MFRTEQPGNSALHLGPQLVFVFLFFRGILTDLLFFFLSLAFTLLTGQVLETFLMGRTLSSLLAPDQSVTGLGAKLPPELARPVSPDNQTSKLLFRPSSGQRRRGSTGNALGNDGTGRDGTGCRVGALSDLRVKKKKCEKKSKCGPEICQ